MSNTLIYDAYFDGAVGINVPYVGIGGVICAPSGEIVDSYSIELPYRADLPLKDAVLLTEYLSGIELLTRLHALGIRNAIVYTDCKGLANAVNRRRSNKFNRLDKFRELVLAHNQFQTLLRGLAYVVVKWVPRASNNHADFLSRRRERSISQSEMDFGFYPRERERQRELHRQRGQRQEQEPDSENATVPDRIP